MTPTPGTTWATYRAGGSLPTGIQQLCEQLDTGDKHVVGPLGGEPVSAILDYLNANVGD